MSEKTCKNCVVNCDAHRKPEHPICHEWTGAKIQPKQTFTVWIAWGEAATREAEEIVSSHRQVKVNELNVSEYSFNTEAERTAFLQGVDESSGWMNYYTTTNPKHARKLQNACKDR